MRILKQNRLTLKEMKQTNVGVQLKQDKSSQVLWNFVCKHIQQRFCLPIVETAAAEALRYPCLLRFSCLDLWSPQQQHFQFFPYFYMSPALPSLTQFNWHKTYFFGILEMWFSWSFQTASSFSLHKAMDNPLQKDYLWLYPKKRRITPAGNISPPSFHLTLLLLRSGISLITAVSHLNFFW